MAGYRIIETYYNKLAVNHIPYFVGMLIEGPNGGLYIADEFSSERIFWSNDMKKVGYEMRAIRINERVRDIPKNMLSIAGGRTSDDTFDRLCRMIKTNNPSRNFKLLKRCGREAVKKIGEQLV